jgi:hypothetical protein
MKIHQQWIGDHAAYDSISMRVPLTIKLSGPKRERIFFALVLNMREPLLNVTTHGCPERECVAGFGASTQPSIAVKSG